MAAAPATAVLALAVAAVAPLADGDLRVAVGKMAVAVASARHLPVPAAVAPRLVSRADLRAMDEAALNPGGAAQLYVRLGLVPDDPAAASGEGAVATYDPVTRRLSVPDWIPLADQREALAHALGHAVTDARFGERQFLRIDDEGRRGLDGDATRARLAVVEGDATLAAVEAFDPRGALTGVFALRGLAERLRATGDGVPFSISWARAEAAFAHGDGLAFVARVRTRAPWSAVDALWAAPPRSSEQVLHPEKYDAREAPMTVDATAPPALAAWREVSADVLGELGVRAWLARAVEPPRAERAAAGWGGDRAALFVAQETPSPDAGASDAGAPAPTSFVAWRTLWDDAAEAEDFARAAAPVLARLANDPAASLDDPHRVVARGAGAVWALAWRDAAVSLLLGAPESALPALDELLPRKAASSRAARVRQAAPK
ncbi:MAG TPA: hypothetical protein VHJ20_18480 [Polyangia bacterium]|nr:hypothetical protein [Polyangia bacterium]